MPRAAELMVGISADVRRAVAGIEDVRKEVRALRGESRMASTTWSGFLGGLAKVGLAAQGVRTLVGLVSGLGRGITNLAASQAEEEAGMLRLRQAIENTGRAVDADLGASIESTVMRMEALTGFADQELRQALALLVTETGDLDVALDRLGLSADVARFKQMGLTEAAFLLGKVNEDNIAGLQRLGLITEREVAGGLSESAAAAQLAARAGIDYARAQGVIERGGRAAEGLLKKYGIALGGVASSGVDAGRVLGQVRGKVRDFAKVSTTDAQRLRNDWRNLQEDIGGLFLPLFGDLVRAARGGVKWLRAAFADPKQLKGVKEIARNMTSILRVIRAFATGGIKAAREEWQLAFGEEMPKAVELLFETVKGLTGLGLTIAAFITGGLPDAKAEWNRFFGTEMPGILEVFFKTVETSVRRGADFLGKLVSGLADAGEAVGRLVAKLPPLAQEFIRSESNAGLLMNALLAVGGVAVLNGLAAVISSLGHLQRAAIGARLAVFALVFVLLSAEDLQKPFLDATRGIRVAFLDLVHWFAVEVWGRLVEGALVVGGAIVRLIALTMRAGGQQLLEAWERQVAQIRADMNSFRDTVLRSKVEVQTEEARLALAALRNAAAEPVVMPILVQRFEEIRGAPAGGLLTPENAQRIVSGLYQQFLGGRLPEDPGTWLGRIGRTVEDVTREIANSLEAQLIRLRGAVPMAHGGAGIAHQPTLFLAGERGAEPFAFGRAAMRGPVSITVNVESVDSTERTREIGREVYRAARLAGLEV